MQALTEHVSGDQCVGLCIHPGHECKPLSVMGAGHGAQGAVGCLSLDAEGLTAAFTHTFTNPFVSFSKETKMELAC